MRFEQMKVRPRSTRTITDFRGLWHNLEDQATTDNSRGLRWYDESNLSSDGAPALTVRKGREQRSYIDGTMIQDRIIAVGGGEQLLLIDEFGNAWCNGHKYDAALGSYTWWAGGTYKRPGSPNFQVRVITDNGAIPNNTGYLLAELVGEHERNVDIKYIEDPELFPDILPTHQGWATKVEGEWTAVKLADYNISLDYISTPPYPYPGDIITVEMEPEIEAYQGMQRTITRSGAWASIWPDAVAINTERLAAGYLTDLFEDLLVHLHTVAGDTITVAPCLLDGTVIEPVVSATEPWSQEGYWADTSGNTTVIKKWVPTLNVWQALDEVYLKLTTIWTGPSGPSQRGGGTLHQWDGVTLKVDTSSYDWSGLTEREKAELNAICNSSHVLYGHSYNGQTYETTIIAAGVTSLAGEKTTGGVWLYLDRDVPMMDYVVEAENRLWGCRYGLNNEGVMVNEIYASKLGDPTNWSCYMGLSTDSWTASRGRPAPFTGAATLDGHPLFFREESLEKVFPSSSGAHQIQTVDLEGVQAGSALSVVVIEHKVYYQSRHGICVYSGTLPERISAAFVDLRYKNGIAARHKRKYCISLEQVPAGSRVVAVYDIASGDWHLEDEAWTDMAFTWRDQLYYIDSGKIMLMDGAGISDEVYWLAETGIIGYELPEHRFISCVRIRFQLFDANDGELEVYIQYDDDSYWDRKADIFYSERDKIGTHEVNIYPLRCDHFRLKLAGTGGCRIVSLSYRVERSGGGH